MAELTPEWGEKIDRVVPYTNGFKQQMVKRMLGPTAITATTLSRQVGVPQPTLSKWLRDAATVAAMASDEKRDEARTAAPKKWTAQEKLRVVVAADALEGAALERRTG